MSRAGLSRAEQTPPFLPPHPRRVVPIDLGFKIFWDALKRERSMLEVFKDPLVCAPGFQQRAAIQCESSFVQCWENYFAKVIGYN